jgi:hypothetical protein
MFRKAITIGLVLSLAGGALVLHGQAGTSSASGAEDQARPDESGPGFDGPLGGRRLGRGRFGSLTEEQEQELLTAIRKHNPDRYSRLMEMKKYNPRRYRRALPMLWRWYQEIQRMPEDLRGAVAEDVRLRVRVARLRRAHAAATESETRERIERQLHEAIARRFEIEQKRFEYRLDRMAEHLKRLRSELESREKRREEIIEQRVETLLSDPPRTSGRGIGGRGRRDADRRGRRPRTREAGRTE